MPIRSIPATPRRFAAVLLAVAALAAPPTRAQPAARGCSVVIAGDACTPGAPGPSKRAIRRTMLGGVAPPVAAPSARLRAAGRSTVALTLGGVGGWVVGAAVGAGLGYAILDDSGDAFLPLGTLLGAGVGALAGAPLGVHLANERRGNYLLGLLASAGAGVGSAALLASVLDTRSAAQSVFVIAVPITLQIGTSVAVERATVR